MGGAPPKPASLAQAIYSASPRAWRDVVVMGEGRGRRYFIQPAALGLEGADYETTRCAVMARVRASAKALGFRLGVRDGDRVLDALVDILPDDARL